MHSCLLRMFLTCKTLKQMTARILKQDPNTKRFRRTLIYYDTDTQYTNTHSFEPFYVWFLMRFSNFNHQLFFFFLLFLNLCCYCMTFCMCVSVLLNTSLVNFKVCELDGCVLLMPLQLVVAEV